MDQDSVEKSTGRGSDSASEGSDAEGLTDVSGLGAGQESDADREAFLDELGVLMSDIPDEFTVHAYDVDDVGVRILTAIARADREWVSSSRVREVTGIDSRSNMVSYRFRKLGVDGVDGEGEGEGVLETRQPPLEDGGVMPPKEARLTEEGRWYLASVKLVEPEGSDVRERLEKVISQQQELNERLARLELVLGLKGRGELDRTIPYDRMITGFRAMQRALNTELDVVLNDYVSERIDEGGGDERK